MTTNYHPEDWRHPSIVPEEEGIYELAGWLGDTAVGVWTRNGSKYGVWHIQGKDVVVDKDAIAKFRFKKEVANV